MGDHCLPNHINDYDVVYTFLENIFRSFISVCLVACEVLYSKFYIPKRNVVLKYFIEVYLATTAAEKQRNVGQHVNNRNEIRIK